MLIELLTLFDVVISPKKSVAPCTSLVCLGIVINTETRTKFVSPDKLEYVLNMYCQWQRKQFSSNRRSQSLLRSLLYMSI